MRLKQRLNRLDNFGVSELTIHIIDEFGSEDGIPVIRSAYKGGKYFIREKDEDQREFLRRLAECRAVRGRGA